MIYKAFLPCGKGYIRADYWKSQGRKFCDFCKCWIADNKPSIQFHEGGKKHKDNVSKRLKEIHKNSAKQAKLKKKFDNDFKRMEDAAMAAYLKDVQGNTVDLTAQQIISNKQERVNELSNKVPNYNQMPEASAETNPRHKSSQNLPADVDFCDPTTFHRARVSQPENVNKTNSCGDNKTQTKGKINKEKRKGKKGQDEDSLGMKSIRKVWYEAKSPEGYTYYWNVDTNETTWEPPEDGFMTIAEQEEEAKEQAIQAEFLEQIASEEAKEKAAILEEQRANAEREKFKVLKKQRQANNKESNVLTKDEEGGEVEDEVKEEIPYRRDYSVPDKVDPYGPWQTVEITPRREIDLQLPQTKVIQAVKPEALEPPVPQRAFKEKTISRISTDDSDDESAPTTFKKRKFGHKNVRKRFDDD